MPYNTIEVIVSIIHVRYTNLNFLAIVILNFQINKFVISNFVLCLLLQRCQKLLTPAIMTQLSVSHQILHIQRPVDLHGNEVS